jgi:FtsZ-binding cell division protein ZapB
MNLIGKIFVAVILLLSVVFMILAMATYSTHRNWKTAYTAVNNQLTERNAELQRNDSAHKLQVEELQQQIDASNQLVRNLQSDRQALLSRNEDIQTEINDLKQERRDATAAVASTQANSERLAKENVTLQGETISAQEAADRAFQTTVEATAQLHDATVKLDNAQQLTDDLTQQVAGMTAVLRANDIDPATRAGDVVPKVDGFVSLVRRRAGDETIEITIGSDDGIKRGHTVEVYRSSDALGQSKYLGRAFVLNTDGDKAYARIIPEFKQARIVEGDRVTTRL